MAATTRSGLGTTPPRLDNLHQRERVHQSKPTVNTRKVRSTYSGRTQNCAQSTLRFRSGKGRPCPVCNRQKNSSCSWGDDLILCFKGDSHRPPEGLKIGETIRINGEQWAFVADDVGFAGLSSCFKRHNGRARKHIPSYQQKRNINVARSLVQEVLDDIERALAVLEFESAPPDELAESFRLIDLAHAKSESLGSKLYRVKEQHLREAFLSKKKELGYQKKDADDFRTYYLGMTL